MAKLQHLLAIFFLLTKLCSSAQSYTLRYTGAPADLPLIHSLALDSQFSTRSEASVYLALLPAKLQGSGYITASIDSIQLDSTAGRVWVYPGLKYQWASISLSAADQDVKEAIRWGDQSLRGRMEFTDLRNWQQKILDYLEESGHPFGKVYLDSITLNGDKVAGRMRIERGPLYNIDSIRVYGDVKVNNLFLQRYLDIPEGSIYNRKKLNAVSRRMAELQYLEEEKPADLSLLGSGAVLNLYLKPRRSSQVNALIGFLPNSAAGSGKLLLTVDANVLLRNALGSGETIGLVWQQLQQQSPRLNLLFEQPYIFRSKWGLNFSFDMYKRDSSFLNLNFNLGTTYRISERRTTSIFFQRRQSIINNVNTVQVLQTRQLPQEIDVSSLNLGMSYHYNSTNYRFNPRQGIDWLLTLTAGTKTIKRNNQILELKDPLDPNFSFASLYDTVKMKTYQFRMQTSFARYFPVGKQSAVKTGLIAGWFQSPNYFRNELFQIGGYKTLRGFNEESQFVSKYAVGTIEYRYLIGMNSAFFAFVDGGYGYHVREVQMNHSYLGTGLGLSLETKAGVINIAWAVGQRDDIPFNLRQSKVHLGFASYF